MPNELTINNLSEQEREIALKILNEMNKGNTQSYTDLMYADYEEIPVDIETFIHDRQYLGNALYDPDGRFTLFPYWEDKLKDIFPTNTTTRYNTLILTGAIGLGKTLVADICLLYLLYRLLCLKDPYLFYGMQPIDKISISMLNITIEAAKGVALDKMNQMILSSDWFMSHGKMKGTVNLEYVPEKHIEIIVGSSNNQIIGRAIFANFTDEANFALTNDVERAKKKQKTLISQVDARMKSRYMRGTYLPTLNIIASSKNQEQSFLEDYIQEKRKNESTNTLIVDEPQWVVDSRKDTKEKFYVAIGNKFLANEVLPIGVSEELVEEYTARGYTMLKVPMGYRENFLENLDGALTDIAGIATASSLKYISGIRWNECISTDFVNPFIKEVLVVGDTKEDTAQYWDFFDMSKVPNELKSRPMYVHLDMSKSGDHTGIVGVWITQKNVSNEENDSRSLFYQVAFACAIEAPKGAQISFEKNKRFVYWLRDNGFSIRGVTSDTYQSAPVLQDLRAHGFTCNELSVDRLTGEGKDKLCEPYHYLKSTIYDKRLRVFKTDLLTKEIVGLERLSNGKIDHTTAGINSKDIADALCGSIFNASKNAEQFAFDYGENLEAIVQNNSNTSDKQQLTIDFEEELKKTFGSSFEKEMQKQSQEPTFLDFGFGKATPLQNANYVSQGIVVW